LADLKAVFEPLYQANPVNSFGSLGLGLTLVRGIVEKHGGTVNVHSDGRGRGSEFTFTIPIAQFVPQAASTPNRR
jgi:two-component system CheB/CheR fusion protein